MSDFYIGLDLGQSQDFTAIAVLEWANLTGEWDPSAFSHRLHTIYRLRHLERMPLGTPYPEVVMRVGEVVEKLSQDHPCQLIVDGTGVGRPVVDMLRSQELDCVIRPVLVTAGHGESESDGFYHVPKRDLIVGLQVLLQSGVLKIAKNLRFAPELVNEMAEMRVKVTTSGNEQFGAWREGTHDDLIFAVALACWGAERWYPRDMHQLQRLL